MFSYVQHFFFSLLAQGLHPNASEPAAKDFCQEKILGHQIQKPHTLATGPRFGLTAVTSPKCRRRCRHLRAGFVTMFFHRVALVQQVLQLSPARPQKSSRNGYCDCGPKKTQIGRQEEFSWVASRTQRHLTQIYLQRNCCCLMVQCAWRVLLFGFMFLFGFFGRTKSFQRRSQSWIPRQRDTWPGSWRTLPHSRAQEANHRDTTRWTDRQNVLHHL